MYRHNIRSVTNVVTLLILEFHDAKILHVFCECVADDTRIIFLFMCTQSLKK
jgi:hypothetical protein